METVTDNDKAETGIVSQQSAYEKGFTKGFREGYEAAIQRYCVQLEQNEKRNELCTTT